MQSKLTPPLLRIILIAILVLLLAGGVTGFIFIHKKLVEKANETATVSAQAKGSQNKLQDLKKSQAKLDENAAVEAKVNNMVATGLKYTYQDEIILALQMLGNSANVKVTNIDFGAATPLGSAAPTGTTATTQAPTATDIPANVKLTQANVTLATPLPYEDLLRFIKYVEQNTMTMKVSKLSISSTGKVQDGHVMVSCDVLTVGVYTHE